jgi:drug/metabolite transporter, DME family
MIDREQVAEVRSDVLFKESRRTMLAFLVGVSGKDDELRTGSGHSVERLQNCIDGDVATNAVEAASVKDERERFRRALDRTNVPANPVDFDAGFSGFSLCLFNRQRREIDSRHFEATLSEQNCVGTRAAAELQHAAWLNIRLLDHSAKFSRGQSAVPGRAAGFVSLIPVLCTIHFLPRNSTRSIQLFLLRNAKVLRRGWICSDTSSSNIHRRFSVRVLSSLRCLRTTPCSADLTQLFAIDQPLMPDDEAINQNPDPETDQSDCAIAQLDGLSPTAANQAQPVIKTRRVDDELGMGILLGICAAIGYSGANLALRQLAIPNDPGWAIWVTANKAIPAALVAWLMIFVQWSRGEPGLPPGRMIWRLILVGLVMQYAGNFMFQWSLSIGGLAITVPVCFSMLIIAGAWMSRLVCGEEITPKTMGAIGILIVAVGVLSSGAGSATMSMGHADSWKTTTLAILSAAVSGVAYGATGVVVRRLVTGTLTIPSSLVVLSTTGAVTMTAHAFLVDGPAKLFALSEGHWPAIIGAGVMNAAAFFAVAGSLKRIPVTFLNILNASQNAMCAIGAVLLFAEPVTWPLVAGCVLTMFGILLVDRGKQPTKE